MNKSFFIVGFWQEGLGRCEYAVTAKSPETARKKLESELDPDLDYEILYVDRVTAMRRTQLA